MAFVNGRTSEFYLVSDLQVKLLGIVTTTTMNHHRRGGSSSGRLARLRENKIDHNVAYICEEIETHFAEGTPLLIGGCAEIRHQVAEELSKTIQLVGCSTWQGTGNSSAREFWASKREIFVQWVRKNEQLSLEPLWKLMNTEPDRLLYGVEIDDNVCEAIYFNANQHKVRKYCQMISVYHTDSLDIYGGRIGVLPVQ